MKINEIKTLNECKAPSTISIKGLNAICCFEGFRAKAYRCPSGRLTIGYGHTENVKISDHINIVNAQKLLNDDLSKVYPELRIIKGLTQGQFDALTSFIFNVGVGNWRRSTLRKMIINDMANPLIRNEFKKWIRSNGVILKGLIKRREWEACRYYEKD